MIVVSCDHYTEVGKPFFDLQKKYMGWFQEPIYFVNESKEVSFDGVRVIHVGTDVNWSGKMLRALEQIPQKYVIFMLEDYFIGKEVLREHVYGAVRTMQAHGLRYYKITAIPDTKKKSDIAPYLSVIPSNLRYGVNLQAAIFEKTYLQQVVSGPDRSAWETETDLLKQVTDGYEYDLPGCVLDRRNIIDVHNGVIKGKWVRKTVRYFRRQGYDIDLGDRPVLPVGALAGFHFKAAVARMLPASKVKGIKKVLKKFGMKFVSEN